MDKPSNLLIKLARNVFDNLESQEKFIEALVYPKLFNPCILWCQDKPDVSPFALETPLPWQPSFVDRLAIGEKPGKHSLHNAGYFYCLDFSSIFAVSTLLTIQMSVKIVVDMCAAPGGKSVFTWRCLQPERLLCNEVIGKRTGMLISNLKRCQIEPSSVISRDSSIVAKAFPKTSSLVMVDAPCTGQSLLAKGDKAPGCFHPTSINKSANRQKRIIANSAQVVAPQGYLAYMTCTYSPEENEQICEWLIERFPQFTPVLIPHLAAYQSHLTSMPCYRMWPQDGLGAGAFTVLFKNNEEGAANQFDLDVLSALGVFKPADTSHLSSSDGENL